MRYFYRDTTETGEWQEITQNEALVLVDRTYQHPGDIHRLVQAGEPVCCSIACDGKLGQIKAEV